MIDLLLLLAHLLGMFGIGVIIAFVVFFVGYHFAHWVRVYHK